MFESAKMQTKLRTNQLKPNENILFPFGTLFLTDRLDEVQYFYNIFRKKDKRYLYLWYTS